MNTQDNFLAYFQKDGARTFPVPTDVHCKHVLDGLTTNLTFDGYAFKQDENSEVGILMENLKQIIHAAALADCIKSAVFYKKEKNYEKVIEELTEGFQSQGEWAVGPKSVRLLHALLGMQSELGELARVIILGMMNDENFDMPNVKEELGDVMVYASEGATATELTLEECMATNIAKRAKRFPEGFSEFHAVNRDLEGERAILEGTKQ